MKDKFYRFMQGRYGVDQFAKFTMGVALVSISGFFPEIFPKEHRRIRSTCQLLPSCVRD